MYKSDRNRKSNRSVAKNGHDVQNRTLHDAGQQYTFVHGAYCTSSDPYAYGSTDKQIGFKIQPKPSLSTENVKSLKLSEKDARKFVEEVWNSPGPSEELKAAAARYKRRTGK